MGLDKGIRMLLGQRATDVELGIGAGRCKTRGDAVVLAALVVPALYQRFALVVAALRSIEQRGGGIAIH
ncbi:hypothetical protein D3C77_595680 [compost metagenome]